MTDVAHITAPPESFASVNSATEYDRPPNGDAAMLDAASVREEAASPARTGATDTQSTSTDDDKAPDGHEGASRPSNNVSGASSVSGNGVGSFTTSFAPPLTAKKGPQSFFSGSKIKHLKKPDGIPLWRVDIQYDFLHAVFHDTRPVFTNTYTQATENTFADIYLDAMARSSKTSKILRDKLMTERGNALNMAMVCLLVNVGRMNTTLNFFPEMKAQLRTYHAIPSLQAHSDSSAYKQLQDAPRLKSILKGACEDDPQPQNIDEVMAKPAPPRTNPINLIFILSTYAPRISEQHFPPGLDFYDLIMRSTLSSKSRAKAFLWLMWFYLESDFSEQACRDNPYGPGQTNKDKALWRVPDFEPLTEEQAAKENVDTENELEYGELKRQERKKLLGDIHNAPPGTGRGRGRRSTALGASPDVHSPNGSPPPGRRGGRPRHSYADAYEYESETHSRSGTPDSAFQTPANGSRLGRRVSSIAKYPNPMDSSIDSAKYKAQRIIMKSKGVKLGTPDNMYGGRTLLPLDKSSPSVERAPRPRMTTYQMAVQQNRQDRVAHIIDRKLRHLDKRRRKQRLRQGAIVRCWERIKDYADPLVMSDDEETLVKHSHNSHNMLDEEGHLVDRPQELDVHSQASNKRFRGSQKYVNGNGNRGPAGLIPRQEEEYGENDDYGEEALSFAAALRRSSRRIQRWEDIDRRQTEASLVLQESGAPAALPAAPGDQATSGAPGESEDEEMADIPPMQEAAVEEDESDEDERMG